jgi:toxin ParE1/3/4
MGRIERLPQAVEDLIEIWEHIAVDNSRRVAADRLLQRFDETLRVLSDQRELGLRQDQFSPGLRAFVVGRYVLFYRPLDDGIRLIRVLHSARRFEGLFAPE